MLSPISFYRNDRIEQTLNSKEKGGLNPNE